MYLTCIQHILYTEKHINYTQYYSTHKLYTGTQIKMHAGLRKLAVLIHKTGNEALIKIYSEMPVCLLKQLCMETQNKHLLWLAYL